MSTIAIIGTAGRDKTRPMSLPLWKFMLKDAMSRVPKGAHVVSGGAAWADHLAVSLFLFGHAGALTLHLPAPFENGQYTGPHNISASAANYYHGLFSSTISRNTLEQIQQVLAMPNCTFTEEAAMSGFRGMFARNAKVALADEMLAYTFGEGEQPADGGTLDTWNKCQGRKTHISLLNHS